MPARLFDTHQVTIGTIFKSLFECVHYGTHALLEAQNYLADWYLGIIASAVIDALANFSLQQTW